MIKVVRELYDPEEEGFNPSLETFTQEECERRVALIGQSSKKDNIVRHNFTDDSDIKKTS